MSVPVKVLRRNGTPLVTLQVPADATVKDLKALFQKQKGTNANRQRFYINVGNTRTTLDDEKTLKSYGLGKASGNEVYFSDLGPQVAWKTVFLVEYAGPLLIYVFFYLQPWFIYGRVTKPHSYVQNVAFWCWVGHYAKRELETLFVHRFSHGTMPLLNIFKNSGYYWGAGALCGYFINHPLYTDPPLTQVHVALALFVLFELGNLYCHIILRNLRPAGTKVRNIPRGFLFELVSCPNYTFEIAAWFAFTVMTQTVAALLFALMGAGQMLVWAQAKHRRYRKEFDKYPKNRKILIPFIY